MILHIPHSSTYLPDTFQVPEGVSLKKEFQRMTDWYTVELFDFPGAKKLVFPYSRLYCDVERFRDDGDEVMAEKGVIIGILKKLEKTRHKAVKPNSILQYPH